MSETLMMEYIEGWKDGFTKSFTDEFKKLFVIQFSEESFKTMSELKELDTELQKLDREFHKLRIQWYQLIRAIIILAERSGNKELFAGVPDLLC